MKDKQIAPVSVEPRIFLVSAVLHCVCMTAVVYLRSSFGFGYLRPKSVFFAFSWAFALYAVYAWNEGMVWREHRALLLFGAGAVILYWVHFLVALGREWRESGEHEQHSGVPHLVWMLRRRTGNSAAVAFESKIRLWVEPAAVALLAAISGLAFGERGLARWLAVLSFCLWAKEAFNRWFALRQRKRQKDLFADAGDAIEPPTASDLPAETPTSARKAKVRRVRTAEAAVPDPGHQRQMAERLRLMPPYTRAQAEANYRELIKVGHPDASGDSEENNVQAAQLNEAIEYFRRVM